MVRLSEARFGNCNEGVAGSVTAKKSRSLAGQIAEASLASIERGKRERAMAKSKPKPPKGKPPKKPKPRGY